VREDESFVGGGSLPDVTVPTAVLALSAEGLSETDLAARLRTGTPAVVGRVQDGRVLLDLRCVFERQEADLLEAVRQAVQA
jgi:L-seryl-tRNA(Ser) seleniumtransferase